MLTVIDKVIFLQNVDVFSAVTTEQLAFLAAIAEEIPVRENEAVYREEEPSDAMYLVLSGRVRLHRGPTEVTTAGPQEAFGIWALFDDEPRVTAATAAEDCELLRIDKEDFIEVLADNVLVMQGVMKAIVRRLRALGRAIHTGSNKG
ncbi:MAG: Crp/Fnr family transcriptional regulator [Myxococcota bacterium]